MRGPPRLEALDVARAPMAPEIMFLARGRSASPNCFRVRHAPCPLQNDRSGCHIRRHERVLALSIRDADRIVSLSGAGRQSRISWPRQVKAREDKMAISRRNVPMPPKPITAHQHKPSNGRTGLDGHMNQTASKIDKSQDQGLAISNQSPRRLIYRSPPSYNPTRADKVVSCELRAEARDQESRRQQPFLRRRSGLVTPEFVRQTR